MKRVLPPAHIDPSTKNRPVYYKVVEVIGTSLFLVYMVLFGYGLIQAVGLFEVTVVGFVLMLTLPVVGYVLADFFSGFVHFLGDTFGNENIPILGPNFIRPFRAHHIDEKEITRHNFFEVNGTNCVGSLLILLPTFYFLPITASIGYFLVGEVIWFMIFSVFLTNQIHKWAHQDNPPASVRFLQRHRIILSPEHHQTHHTAPFATYYCITSGWLNHFLQRLHFFEGIVRLVRPRSGETKASP